MDKLILPDSFDYGPNAPDRLVSLLDVSRRTGVDRGQLAKRAAVLTREISNVKPEPGTSVLHVVAMGATEDYGPNKNADGYKRAMLERDHPTFVSEGHVYKEHNNDDVKKASGDVLASAYNDDMKRVELLIRVDDRKWEPELQKVASGGDVTVSMSCHVPYDQCVICGNQAKRRADYCGCMKKMAGRMLDDGRLVYVDNPSGRFFDISAVRNRADRIAFGLQKVASGGPVATGAELFDLARGAAPITRRQRSVRAPAKRAAAVKLAEIEKEIDGLIRARPEAARHLSAALPERDLDDAEADKLARAGEENLPGLLRGLGDARISLSLRDFVRVVLRGLDCSDQDLDDAECGLPGIFGKLDDEDCGDGAYDADDQAGLPASLKRLVGGLVGGMSLDDEPVKCRVVRVTLRGKLPEALGKRASAAERRPTAKGTQVAREYAKYKLAWFDKLARDGRGCSDQTLRLGLLQHYRR